MARLTGPFFSDDAVDSPYWWEVAKPISEDRTELPTKSEVTIVGAGFTGLNAALTLARAGKEVTVLDAEAPGWGASSRNGGMLGPGWATFDTAMTYGAEKARCIVAESFLALRHVKDIVAREAIACDLAVVGYFRGAMTPRLYDAMGRNLDRIRKAMPCDAYLVPRAEQQGEIGTDLYHGGLAMPGYAGLHPARYVTGLADAARRAGARIFGGARVSAIETQAGGFILSVGRERISTRQLLVATNGYTGSLLPFLQRRIIPIRSAMIATEPLSTAAMDRLMPKRRMLAGSQRVVTYFRPSPDGTRILFGGRVLKLADKNVAAANAGHLRKQMLQVFPELRGGKITHYWHGQTGFTFDKLPHLGEHEGIFYACGYNGTGIARASWFGHRIAQRMLGEAEHASAYADLPFRTRLLYRGRPWFLPLAVVFYEILDRWDQR
jgi:glycine/D-amino acid oxidase-like deaminating enzyme